MFLYQTHSFRSGLCCLVVFVGSILIGCLTGSESRTTFFTGTNSFTVTFFELLIAVSMLLILTPDATVE